MGKRFIKHYRPDGESGNGTAQGDAHDEWGWWQVLDSIEKKIVADHLSERVATNLESLLNSGQLGPWHVVKPQNDGIAFVIDWTGTEWRVWHLHMSDSPGVLPGNNTAYRAVQWKIEELGLPAPEVAA